MKRSTALAAAALATACAIPATAPAQKPPKPAPGAVSLTLGAAPNPVLAGRILTLSGRLTADKMANQKVDLTSDPFPFDKLGKAGTATTNAAGDFQLIQRPTANTRYQARKGQGESAIVTVLVRPRVGLRLSDSTPSAGQRVRFSGRVCPEHDGTTMAIQRRSGGRFKTIRRTVLRDVPGSTCSSYRHLLRVRADGSYRTVIRGHADHARGASPVRSANVS
ncbi:MAG TPA: hypothetical protein VFD31_08130 [Thermoleophilaceae bacterium]|nr:hypothetical protein [Thermoleophilaceae bacterium]